MASTEEILEAARKVGNMVSEHDSAKKLEDVLHRLENDVEAQRTLNDYNRHLQTLSQKQQQGQPIEVADKQKLEELQKAVATNPLLRELQTVQMDYVDLLRKIDEAIAGSTPTGDSAGASSGGAPSSPLVNPNLAT